MLIKNADEQCLCTQRKLIQNFDARVHEDHEEETEELSGFKKRNYRLQLLGTAISRLIGVFV